jgi:hypothetical protein
LLESKISGGPSEPTVAETPNRKNLDNTLDLLRRQEVLSADKARELTKSSNLEVAGGSARIEERTEERPKLIDCE